MDILLKFAPYYFYVYWFCVLLMTIGQYNSLSKSKGYEVINRSYDFKPIIVFTVFFILFFGFRPISAKYFGDTANYAKNFRFLEDFGVFNAKGEENIDSDWLFYSFQKFCAQTMNLHLWFTIMLACYMIPMVIGCKKLLFRHGALIALFCFGAFSFYTYAVNGVRNGIACSFTILALAYLCKRKMLLAAIWSFVAVSCHKATVLPIVAMFFTYFVNKPKYMFAAWFGAIAVSLAFGDNIDSFLSAMNLDERLANNLQSDDADGVELEHRFRWDFLLYSSMPILLAWYTIYKRKLYDNIYLLLLGTYMYSNSFWVLAIRGIFSNRIAYLSWFIYPVVLAYPLLRFEVFKKNHGKKTAMILLAQFGFTSLFWFLFM